MIFVYINVLEPPPDMMIIPSLFPAYTSLLSSRPYIKFLSRYISSGISLLDGPQELKFSIPKQVVFPPNTCPTPCVPLLLTDLLLLLLLLSH